MTNNTSDTDSAPRPIFRRGDAADAPAILRVIQSAFPRWPPFEIDVPAVDHLRWKMTPPAPLPNDMHAIVELNGEIVAAQIRWPSRVHFRQEELPYESGADLAVHQSAQGLGLSRLIRKEERARVQPQRLVGYDTAPTNERVIHMQGDGAVRRPLDVWVRPFVPREFVAVHLRSGGPRHLAQATVQAATHIARSRLASTRGRTPLPPERRIEVDRPFDDRATTLWEQVRRQYDLAKVRNADWLNWRYLDPRAGRITTYTMAEGDRLLGYAAFKRNGAHATVLDLVTDPGSADAGAQLLERGATDLRRDGCRSVECLLPRGHREERALRNAGFHRAGVSRALQFTRARHASLPAILEMAEDPSSRIHVMLGDFDHA